MTQTTQRTYYVELLTWIKGCKSQEEADALAYELARAVEKASVAVTSCAVNTVEIEEND